MPTCTSTTPVRTAWGGTGGPFVARGSVVEGLVDEAHQHMAKMIHSFEELAEGEDGVLTRDFRRAALAIYRTLDALRAEGTAQ